MTYETSDELYHYGVLGMRWGHRKASYYDKRADTNAKKVANRKTHVGKMAAANREATNRYYAQRRRDINNSKSLREKYNAAYGYQAQSSQAKAQSKMDLKGAQMAKTKLFKQGYKVKSMNSKYRSDYATKVNNSKTTGERIANKYMGVLKMPYTSYTGRTTSTGKALAEYALGYGYILDAAYLNKNKKDFGKV